MGERKYALGRDARVKFRRVALHASYLELLHPATGVVISFKCDLPEDMSRLLKS